MTQASTGRIESCPACERSSVENIVDAFDGVCTDCGFVIRDGSNPMPPDWMITGAVTEQSECQDWSTVCRVQNATEQQLAEAFDSLQKLADRLHLLTPIRQSAADVYADGFRLGTTDGRDTSSFVAAAVRVASLRAEEPVPESRLTEPPAMDRGKYRLSYAALQDDLELSLPVPTPADYIPFLVRSIEPERLLVQRVTDRLEKVAEEHSLMGKDPAGVAAAVFYCVGQDLTQSDVAAAAGVSTETIRQRASQLQDLKTNV